jgi:polar amino acid transport system substrate-binding protein
MKIVRTLAAAVVLIIGAVPADAGETLDRVLAAGRLVNAVDEEYPPFSYRDATGAMAGFDIDVAAAVAKRLGVAIEQVTPGWDEITAGDWRGRWDICVCSMTASREPPGGLAFVAPPYYHRQFVAVVRADSGIARLSELAGRRVGIQAGTPYDEVLASPARLPDGLRLPIHGAEMMRYDTEPLAIADLVGGAARLDAAILDRLTASEQIADGKTLRILAPLVDQPMAVAIEAGDPAFAARIKDIIRDMRIDGTLRALSERRFGIDLTAPPSE